MSDQDKDVVEEFSAQEKSLSSDKAGDKMGRKSAGSSSPKATRKNEVSKTDKEEPVAVDENPAVGKTGSSDKRSVNNAQNSPSISSSPKVTREETKPKGDRVQSTHLPLTKPASSSKLPVQDDEKEDEKEDIPNAPDDATPSSAGSKKKGFLGGFYKGAKKLVVGKPSPDKEKEQGVTTPRKEDPSEMEEPTTVDKARPVIIAKDDTNSPVVTKKPAKEENVINKSSSKQNTPETTEKKKIVPDSKEKEKSADEQERSKPLGTTKESPRTIDSPRTKEAKQPGEKEDEGEVTIGSSKQNPPISDKKKVNPDSNYQDRIDDKEGKKGKIVENPEKPKEIPRIAVASSPAPAVHKKQKSGIAIPAEDDEGEEKEDEKEDISDAPGDTTPSSVGSKKKGKKGFFKGIQKGMQKGFQGVQNLFVGKAENEKDEPAKGKDVDPSPEENSTNDKNKDDSTERGKQQPSIEKPDELVTKEEKEVTTGKDEKKTVKDKKNIQVAADSEKGSSSSKMDSSKNSKNLKDVKSGETDEEKEPKIAINAKEPEKKKKGGYFSNLFENTTFYNKTMGQRPAHPVKSANKADAAASEGKKYRRTTADEHATAIQSAWHKMKTRKWIKIRIIAVTLIQKLSRGVLTRKKMISALRSKREKDEFSKNRKERLR
jgi:hypothetical protein